MHNSSAISLSEGNIFLSGGLIKFKGHSAAQIPSRLHFVSSMAIKFMGITSVFDGFVKKGPDAQVALHPSSYSLYVVFGRRVGI
jgi:hypothetical protein